ncbi:MAG: DNA polymerase III subunit beta [Proteobacteria bacterium]|nr:DNA polymerase III subunit beta [Pseudomonadota bacterium]
MPEIRIEQPVLLAMLNRVVPVVSARSTIPILETVRLRVDGRLEISGTDLDNHVTAATQNVEIGGAGAVCMPARKLRELLRACDPVARITLQWDPDGASVVEMTSGPIRYRLNGYSAADYPDRSEFEATHRFGMPAADLRVLLSRVAFAMSEDDARYYLHGAYLHIEGDHLRAVATDGHRLCAQDVALPEGAAGMAGGIVPRCAVGHVLRLLGGAAARGVETVDLAFGPKKVRFAFGDIEIVAKLIDGTFPDYRRVVPPPPPFSVTLPRRHIEAALRRAGALVGRFVSPHIKISLVPDAIEIEAKSVDYGTATERVLAPGAVKAPQIGMNWRYLLEAVRAHQAEDITLAIKDTGSPMLITGDAGCLVVQMPARV